LDSHDEEMVWLQSRTVSLHDRCVSIEVDIRVGPEIHSRWLVECNDAVEHRLSLGGHGRVSPHRDHVLLLDHIDRRAELYFTGAAPDPAKVERALAVGHEGFMGDWRPMNRYLNSLVPLPQLLAESAGKLASGPASLLAVYDETLRFCGMKTSILDAGVAKRWDDERHWVEIEYDLAVVIFGDWKSGTLPGRDPESFVIAPHFHARKIAP
jgi:hypothetical protein